MDLTVKLIVTDESGRSVEKLARVSDCAKAVSKDTTSELFYQVGKALREAQTDLERS